MSVHIFNVAAFRGQFPEFASSVTYPDSTLSAYWDMATNYISSSDSTFGLTGTSVDLALNLMVAHLARSFALLNAGKTSVVVAGSSEGSVSVSLTPPPVKNAWQWWLATTPYGIQLRALLSVLAARLPYVGGSLERASFRKAGGVF